MEDLIDIDPELILRLDKPVPRYTSYPTSVEFQKISEDIYQNHLKNCAGPLSLYIHIPFCKTMCLFCGCSVVLNRSKEKQESYLNSLLKEIELVSSQIRSPTFITQLHLGGGTPTSLTEVEFTTLFTALRKHFSFAPDAEISIEVDPRTVFSDHGQKMKTLKDLGVNRISFGVQDADPVVQEAVKRRQSWEMTETTFLIARDLGFISINIDLIYGLPFQTAVTFSETAQKIVKLNPDRIAFFSYAKVPWLKPHQKAIQDKDLPETLEKFRIYVGARSAFMKAGYVAIGMDHFAKRDDSLAIAYKEKKLQRNFQGYSLQLSENLIGLGVSSIGNVNGGYFQNEKDLSQYQLQVGQGIIPVARGRILTPDDLTRRRVIHRMMCDFEIDLASCQGLYDPKRKEELIKKGLVREEGQMLKATPAGKLFIRHVASIFDQYYKPESINFSKGI